MAGSQTCYTCNLNPDAEFFLTDRHVYPDMDLLPQPTIAICMDCLINLGREFEKARLVAIQSAPDSVGTGVLEQIEGDEGATPIASASPSPKRRRQTTAPEDDTAVPEETEASHEHG